MLDAIAMTRSDGRQPLKLGVPGFDYADLFRPPALEKLHVLFDRWLGGEDPKAHAMLDAWRQNPDGTPPVQVSATIMAVAPHVGRFVAQLFRVSDEAESISRAILADEPVFDFKKHFVKRRVLRPDAGQVWKGSIEDARRVAHIVWNAFRTNEADDEELWIAKSTLAVHEIQEAARRAAKDPQVWSEELAVRVGVLRGALHADPLAWASVAQDAAEGNGTSDVQSAGTLATRVGDAIEATLAARMTNPKDPIHGWVSMHVPHKWQFDNLVPLRRAREDLPELFVGPEGHRRQRVEPFALTDHRGSRRQVAQQVEYCVYCHERDKDSCSKGLHDKQGEIKRNPLGVKLNGCPLDEKIGEMNALRRSGEVIGSLATASIDNPMTPGTGHRICNDCMKSCIYQTQEPVDIPQIETRALTDVLGLPYGYEIYSFLTRWNPLNVRRPYALPYNGKNVLVIGLGPAGYTLAHHLLNEGFGVVGVDGLKLEPLPIDVVGSTKKPPVPIKDYRTLMQPLDSRTLLGFGGVSEYGITVRWDKNFLTLLYLNLLRRNTFRAYGGVRFGGTLTLDDAWELGFDHVAIAAGAGKPTYIQMKNNLIRGVRKASDFLMALQLTGALKRNSLANLQVRLPAVVIGSGLTAIDTATELLAYYVVQAERTLERYETLVREQGEATIRARFDIEEIGILDEVVGHGRELRAERELAAREGREPRITQLLDSWGGVSIVYRRRLVDSPACRLNHEEVTKSLEEGVRYVELLTPVEAHPDKYGAVEAMTFERMRAADDERTAGGSIAGTGETVKLPARTVCIAAGTAPNVSYEREYEGTFELDQRGYFANHRAVRDDKGQLRLERTTDGGGFFTNYFKDGRTVSYYGDNHPKYAGSVVKAMASGKHGYAEVAKLFAHETAKLTADTQVDRDAAWFAFGRKVSGELLAVVQEVKRLAPDIVEVVIKAPLAARKFEPGQFYRLQNFEAYAPRVNGTSMLMEGLALTGAWVDREKGLLSTIALEMGTSSRMCAMLRPGEPVILMGPTGQPTETPGGETVLLLGGGLGNAVLFSIAKAFKNNGSRVLYFAGFRHGESLFKQDEVESSTDVVVWSTDTGATIEPRRPQDHHFRGNIVQALIAYQEGHLGEKKIDLNEVDRIIAIGSDRMMAAVKEARKGVLAPYLKPCHRAIGSINSPMQCMLKAVCAQCLQKVVDPETGAESVVYTCFNQDQDLDRVDFAHLATRLRQNSSQEKISNLWFDRLVKQGAIPRV